MIVPCLNFYKAPLRDNSSLCAFSAFSAVKCYEPQRARRRRRVSQRAFLPSLNWLSDILPILNSTSTYFIIFNWIASFTAFARVLTFSLKKIEEIWLSTVFEEIKRLSAISLF